MKNIVGVRLAALGTLVLVMVHQEADFAARDACLQYES